MRCPRCKAEHIAYKNGEIMYEAVDVCTICGFIIKPSDSKKFVERCAEMIQRHITDFKRTKDVDCVYKADAYFQVLLEEIRAGLEVVKDE